MNAKEIIDEVTSLPVEERAMVVDSLLRSLNPTDSTIDREWSDVAKQRLEEIRSGAIDTVSADEVFEKVKRSFDL
mgnify:CR=1 FL=1